MLHFDTTLCIFSKCFVELVKESNAEEYEFTLPETRTYDIIQDVKNMRSEIGMAVSREVRNLGAPRNELSCV